MQSSSTGSLLPALEDRDDLVRFNALLERIYDGAVNAEAWNDVPRAICEWMNAPVALLFTPLNTLEQGGFLSSHNMGQRALHLWNARYHQMDLWVQRGTEKGLFFTGETVRDQDLATEEELLATEMYREWFEPQDIGRLLTTVVFGLEQVHMPGVVCSLNRPLRHPFELVELERYRMLGPHLARSMGIMFRLREADLRLATTLSALDRLDRAVLLLDRQGRVFHANRLAQDILAQDDGLTLVALTSASDVSELRATCSRSQVALARALQEALFQPVAGLSGVPEVVKVARKTDVRPYALQVSPLPSGNPFGHGSATPAAIVFISPGSVEPAFDEDGMKCRYGLTPAELRVLAQALEGGTSAEMAGRLGVKENTVRTHLQRLYDKTGTRSRSQLVILAMASRLLRGVV